MHLAADKGQLDVVAWLAEVVAVVVVVVLVVLVVLVISVVKIAITTMTATIQVGGPELLEARTTAGRTPLQCALVLHFSLFPPSLPLFLFSPLSLSVFSLPLPLSA